MSDIPVLQMEAEHGAKKAVRLLQVVLSAARAVLARVAAGIAMIVRRGGVLARSAGARVASAIAAVRMPVRHSTHARVTRQLERFELQTIASVRSIECREKRTRALLELSRTAYEIGRDTGIFLSATLAELQLKSYWERKQIRIFSATQLACSVAGLAALSGHPEIGRDAYLCGQQYNGKVDGVDRRIGLATAFADVAALLDARYDQASWLSVAMELAAGIMESRDRLGAVNFVARKMVKDQIPPCEDRAGDRRFAVDAAPVARMIVADVAVRPASSDPEKDELDFEAA